MRQDEVCVAFYTYILPELDKGNRANVRDDGVKEDMDS